jgi:6-pyruvoyltetrahydropterin/6-carboxytetrahydropterin synthase
MYSVTKTFKFDAAHRLLTMPKEHKCSNIHGHSYVVRVSIAVDNIKDMKNPNMVVDFGILKKFDDELDKMDHSLILHQDDPLIPILKNHICRLVVMPNGLDTSAENMASLFANKINHMCIHEFGINTGQIQIEVDETVGNTASYIRDIGGV